jgi:hypothetical protein
VGGRAVGPAPPGIRLTRRRAAGRSRVTDIQQREMERRTRKVVIVLVIFIGWMQGGVF